MSDIDETSSNYDCQIKAVEKEIVTLESRLSVGQKSLDELERYLISTDANTFRELAEAIRDYKTVHTEVVWYKIYQRLCKVLNILEDRLYFIRVELRNKKDPGLAKTASQLLTQVKTLNYYKNIFDLINKNEKTQVDLSRFKKAEEDDLLHNKDEAKQMRLRRPKFLEDLENNRGLTEEEKLLRSQIYEERIGFLEDSHVLRQYDNAIFNVLSDKKKSAAVALVADNYYNFDKIFGPGFLDPNHEKRRSAGYLTNYTFEDVLLKPAKVPNYTLDISSNVVDEIVTMDLKLERTKAPDVYDTVEFERGKGMGSFLRGNNVLTNNNRAANTTIINTENNNGSFRDLLIDCSSPGTQLTPEEYLALLEQIISLEQSIIERQIVQIAGIVKKQHENRASKQNTDALKQLSDTFIEAQRHALEQAAERDELINNFEFQYNYIKNLIPKYYEQKIVTESYIKEYNAYAEGTEAAAAALIDEELLGTGGDDNDIFSMCRIPLARVSEEMNKWRNSFSRQFKIVSRISNAVVGTLFKYPIYIYNKLNDLKKSLNGFFSLPDGERNLILKQLKATIEKETNALNLIKIDFTKRRISLEGYRVNLPVDYSYEKDLFNSFNSLEIDMKQSLTVLSSKQRSGGGPTPRMPLKGGSSAEKPQTLEELSKINSVLKKMCEEYYAEYIPHELRGLDITGAKLKEQNIKFKRAQKELCSNYFINSTASEKTFKNICINLMCQFPSDIDRSALPKTPCNEFGADEISEADKQIDMRIVLTPFKTFVDVLTAPDVDKSLSSLLG